MEIDARTLKGNHNDYIVERISSRLAYSMNIRDQ